MVATDHYHKSFFIDIKAEIEKNEDESKKKRGNTSTK